MKLTQLQIEALNRASRGELHRVVSDAWTGTSPEEIRAFFDWVPGAPKPWRAKDATICSLVDRELLTPPGLSVGQRRTRLTDAGRAALEEARRGGCQRCRRGMTAGRTCGSCGRESHTRGRPT